MLFIKSFKYKITFSAEAREHVEFCKVDMERETKKYPLT
jgi:hypothetical protein